MRSLKFPRTLQCLTALVGLSISLPFASAQTGSTQDFSGPALVRPQGYSLPNASTSPESDFNAQRSLPAFSPNGQTSMDSTPTSRPSMQPIPAPQIRSLSDSSRAPSNLTQSSHASVASEPAPAPISLPPATSGTSGTATAGAVQPASFNAPLHSLPTPIGPGSEMDGRGLNQPASDPKAKGLTLKARSADGSGKIDRPSNSLGSLFSVLFSLGIVVFLFLGLAWLYRKSQPQSAARLPNEVVQVLGRTHIAPRQAMYVIRFGSKLLLVSQQPGQTETLSEITDPQEVDRLAGLMEAKAPHSATQSFTHVLRQVAGVSR